MEAAEVLFATQGFETVSIRDITQATQTNVAAVNYHFGSREGLLTLVMQRYVIPLNEERLARLETIDRKGQAKAAPLEEIIDAWMRPLLGQAKKSELSEPMLHKLVGRIFAMQPENLPAAIGESIQQVSEPFARSYAKALPTLAAEDLAARLHFINGGMIHLLTHPDPLPGAAMEARLGPFNRIAAAVLRDGTETERPVKKGPQATFNF